MPKPIEFSTFTLRDDAPLTLIAGPCVIESLSLALETADMLKQLCKRLGIELIYKSSFDKANRSSVHSFRGPGLDKGLSILSEVSSRYSLPTVTDIHLPEHAAAVAEVCELLQIPAFLCRQTDLIVAAAETGRAVNIKKGQFLAPWDMKGAVEKCIECNNDKIILTERGSTFGYNNLVVDFRSIPIMQGLGTHVCFDATHSLQLPGSKGSSTGGMREHIPTLAKAAVASGVKIIFMEVHPNPAEAKSDSSTVFDIHQLEPLLSTLIRISDAAAI